MKRLLAIVILTAACVAVADEKKPDTASKPTSQPAAKLDPAVERILDRLAKLTVKDVETPLVYIKRDPILEDEQKYEGTLWYKDMKPNPGFLVRFDTFTHEGITRKRKEWYGFDGRWYIEARERSKTIIRKEIVRPGEELNVFELGEGPFPLPFGQKKDQIIERFSIELVPPKRSDPKNSDHLVCTPKSGTEMADKYKKVHFYVNRKLNLPIRVETISTARGDEIIVDFPPDKIRLNKDLPEEKLKLPNLSDYNVETERLPPAPKE